MTTFTTEDKEAVEKSLNAEELADALIKSYGFGGMPALVANALRTLAKRNVELENENRAMAEVLKGRENLAAEANNAPHSKHSIGDDYQHFLSYTGYQHSKELCHAYFHGADADEDEFQKTMGEFLKNTRVQGAPMPLDSTPPQQSTEPVAELVLEQMSVGDASGLRVKWLIENYPPVGTKLYTTPQIKELSDSDLYCLFSLVLDAIPDYATEHTKTMAIDEVHKALAILKKASN